MNKPPPSTRGCEASAPVPCSALIFALRDYIDARIDDEFANREEGEDGYRQTAMKERKAREAAWECVVLQSSPNDRDQRRKGGFRLWFRVVFPALLFAASPLVLLTYNREFPRRSLGAWRAQRATPCSTTNNSTNLLETPLLPVEPFSGPSGSPLRCQALLRLS